MNETCIECGNEMKDRGGPATLRVELDMGDEYTGGGNLARVRVCGLCAKGWVDRALTLTHKQFEANARAAGNVR